MSEINKTGYNDTSNTEQWALNNSVDREFNVLAVEELVYNPVTGTMDRMVQPGATIPTSGTNPSLVLSYDGSGNLTGIAKTIGTTTYTKTLTYVASVLTGVSSWS